MRYHYELKPTPTNLKASVYICNHPVYNHCTLYISDGKGLAVIQQRYNAGTKETWWSDIDPWLINDLYFHEKFSEYFQARAGEPINGLYPTVTIRQIMWALKMKPLERKRWETVFDRRDI